MHMCAPLYHGLQVATAKGWTLPMFSTGSSTVSEDMGVLTIQRGAGDAPIHPRTPYQ